MMPVTHMPTKRDAQHVPVQSTKIAARTSFIVILGFLLYALAGLCLTVISAPALVQRVPTLARDIVALGNVLWLLTLALGVIDFRATPFFTTLEGSVITTYSLTGKRWLDLNKVGVIRATQLVSNYRAGIPQARVYNIWLSDGNTTLNIQLGIIPRRLRTSFYQPFMELLQRLDIEKGSPVSYTFSKWFSYYSREQAELLVAYLHGDI